MIDSYLDILQHICAHPRMVEVPHDEECSLLNVGKMSYQDWRQASRQISVQSYIRSGQGQVPYINTRVSRPSIHHATHRAVRWLSEKIMEHAQSHQRQRYRQMLSQYHWTTMVPQPPDTAAMISFAQDPNYTRLYQKGMDILHHFRRESNREERSEKKSN